MTRNIPRCLCCEGLLVPLIDFGAMPLANTYSVTEPFPLAVNRCTSCYHLQLNESVSPDILFRDYVYCSGTSETALRFFDEFAEMTLGYVPDAGTALDIACNDGTQLNAFKRRGLATTGVDPAANLVEMARANGHEVLCDLFEHVVFAPGLRFDIITAQNVLAHTPDPIEFLWNCKRLMHGGTRLFVTCSQADMIAQGQCDTIYHEHVSYFNVVSMRRLCERVGLVLLDVQMNPIHGTSYVFVIAKDGQESARVMSRLFRETSAGLFEEEIYREWKDRTAEKIAQIRDKINSHREAGYQLVGCGAAAKGITILNMAGVKLLHLFDTTPTKWGKTASGMQISPFDHIATLPDGRIFAFVVLAWNFEEEVVHNVKALRDRPGDVFLTTR